MPRTQRPSAREDIVGRNDPDPKPGEAKKPAAPLPHERDESTRDHEHPVEPVVDQARRDLDDGKEDTDLRRRAGEMFDKRWTGRRNS